MSQRPDRPEARTTDLALVVGIGGVFVVAHLECIELILAARGNELELGADAEGGAGEGAGGARSRRDIRHACGGTCGGFRRTLYQHID